MTDKTKKIIAREGLVFLVALLLVLGSGYLGKPKIGLKLFTLSFLGYPAYLIIRFIVWAIRTLRNK